MRQTILELIQDAPLYRRSEFDISLTRRAVLIYCHKAECEAAIEMFKKKFLREPVGVTFHDAPRKTGECGGLPIISCEELAIRQELLVWLYGTGERKKGIALARLGVRDFIFAVDPNYLDTRFQPDLLIKLLPEVERLDALLSDHESRLTLASIVKQRIRREHGFLRIARYPEYCHPKCQTVAGDFVIDAGACDGKTSLAFAKQSVDGKVYAFEPDPSNLKSIRHFLDKALQDASLLISAAAGIIEIAPYALFSSEASLNFSSNKKGSSTLSGLHDGVNIEVSALSLDLYVERYSVPRVDLVSIDVEGAESHVLDGMVSTIERFRPKLQISMYHRKPDIFNLAFQVERMYPNCAFYLGHHNTYSTETDLYVVPLEKLA